jgi:hypothetical protein
MTAVTPTIEWQFISSWVWGGPWIATEATQWKLPEGEELKPGRPMPNPASLPATGWSMKVGVRTYVGSVGSGPWPRGHLVFSVTPTTGVTMRDWCFDEHNTESYEGNGKIVCNFSDQAEGAVWLTFASAGTFTLSCEYVSSEPATYANVTLSPTLSIVVA